MRSFALAAAAAFVLTVPALAADEDQSATAERNEVVCKTLAANTGTRLGARKICMTRAEWDARRRADQENVQRVQSTGLMGAPEGN